jgi:hypothetical protein
MQNIHKKLPMFSINGFHAYKFGQSWIVLVDNQVKSFERLGLFVAWASDETYKALNRPAKRQAVYFTGLN